jgi:hypothetical protein
MNFHGKVDERSYRQFYGCVVAFLFERLDVFALESTGIYSFSKFRTYLVGGSQ